MISELEQSGSRPEAFHQENAEEEAELAMHAMGLSVKLGNNWILRNLNVEVKRGMIFTLLGPSGCGKTTLMKTLLGLYVPQEGDVAILGHQPRSSPLTGRIGYVPQHLGLHKNLTVGEQLCMYARVSDMDGAAIAARVGEFQSRFRLPPLDTLIQDLSFGEQKLVSVCAALVSGPAVAVLDEPTVGLDPYRRRMLWDYFATMASAGHTIFVTTHHVNEAYRAHTVAIMYNGRLLVQSSPTEVMEAMGVDNLKDAYLKAYTGDQETIQRLPEVQCTSSHVRFVRRPDKVSWRAYLWQSWVTVLVVSQLFFKTIFRNVKRDLIAFAMVTGQFLIVAYCVGPLSFDIPVHILNEDAGLVTSTGTREFYGNTMTRILLDDANTKLEWETLHTHDSATFIDRIELAESYGFLHIPANFTEVVSKTGNDPNADFAFSLYLDATDTNIRGQIIAEVFQSWLMTLLDHGFEDELHNPERVIDYVHGQTQSMTNFFITAIFIAMGVVGGMFSAGTAFMREKEDEALDRLQAMGVASWMIFLADLLPFIPWVLADFPVRFSVALDVMDGPFRGRILPLLALNVIAFSMGNAIGVLCAVCVSSSRELMQMLYSIFFFLYLPSGCIWPIESQPLVMYRIALCNPLMWLVRAFRAVFLRNAALTNKDVLTAFVLPPACGVLAFVLAGLVMGSQTPLMVRARLMLRRKVTKKLQ